MRRESKDHATLSDIYLNNVIMRFMQISEDSTRMFKKVPSINLVFVYLPIATSPGITHEMASKLVKWICKAGEIMQEVRHLPSMWLTLV